MLKILRIKNIHAIINKFPLKQRTRLINNETTMNIQSLLKRETWGSVYKDKGPNHMFNSCLSTLLNIFQVRVQLNTKVRKKK